MKYLLRRTVGGRWCRRLSRPNSSPILGDSTSLCRSSTCCGPATRRTPRGPSASWRRQSQPPPGPPTPCRRPATCRVCCWRICRPFRCCFCRRTAWRNYKPADINVKLSKGGKSCECVLFTFTTLKGDERHNCQRQDETGSTLNNKSHLQLYARYRVLLEAFFDGTTIRTNHQKNKYENWLWHIHSWC